MAEVATKKARPKHLNLMQIRLPIAGYVSILHRVSGVGLFLCLPLILFLFDSSLGTSEQAALGSVILAHPCTKLTLLGLTWAYLHHFCAGIRFLFLDIHKGLDLATARLTSIIVLAVSLSLTILIGVKLW